VTAKSGGTYVCMEGPQFSTRAESNLYRSWGADVIGMTNLQEAKLAREAEICYATAAMVTDYDCWHEGHDDVTVEQIVAVLHQNAANACKVIQAAVAAMPRERACPCASALQYALLTSRDAIPAATREKLDLLIGKHLK
jgi:5'-methylthioadenosine phosphorylase